MSSVGPRIVDGCLLQEARFTLEAVGRNWGVGYATEALWGVVAIATAMGIPQLIAQVHVENTASMRVLEKCLFKREGTMPRQSSFPNLSKERSSQAWTYVRGLG